MHTLTDQPDSAAMALAPVPSGQRIAALDVVRGFALLGICVMNIEFFNRAMSTLGTGMPAGLTGIDWLASYFVAYFVAGKFWTIFSLLFGMGFAVMLTRAETAGRSFLKPYMRRIAALAVFGAVHHIFLFAGDILFSYAVAATYLLVVLYAKTRWLLLAIVLAIGVAFIPGVNEAGGTAAFALAFSGIVALYLRSDKKIVRLSAGAFGIALMATIAAIAALVFWFVPGLPVQPRGPLTAATLLFTILAVLAQKFHDPVAARPWRAGVAIFTLFATMQLAGGLYFYFKPVELAPPVVASASAPVARPAPAASDKAGAKAAVAPKTEAEKKAEAAKDKAERLKKQADKVVVEQKVMSSGSYIELVKFRATHFAEHAGGESGFATLLIGMFLLGTWFIRSGVMENTAAHLPLFRKFAYLLLPLGIGMGIAGSLIATSHVPGADQDGFMLADALHVLGNLPACLGYVGMVVLMLHSRSPLSRIKVLAPFGRMALSNYLMQSLVMSLLFLGHGMALYGMGRAAQLGVAACLLTTQIALSHLWLANFRYGPAEWVWRAITYLKWPAMRIGRAPTGLAAAA
ncbi:DUF418 domain-containing protein [Massilia sp. DWR3-1-1]|uniref:DUF418 domain-containing protein n=1 Tax=Massilia sp. DWR3-1-1 TaxID=2804559 RepID=UPI003CF4C943